MASTIEEIEQSIREAIAPGFRNRLLERGLARSMIWVDGELPEGAPRFAEKLSYDLLSYGYSLLSLAIRLRDLGGNEDLCRSAFEKSATAITDVIHDGNPEDPEKGFHKVLASSAFHLGRYSAKAFSLIQSNLENQNLSKIEELLSLLMLRQFDKIEVMVMQWKASGEGSDESLAERLETEIDQLNQIANTDDEPEEYGMSSIEIPIVQQAITDNYFSSIFEFLFALEAGSQELLEKSIFRIDSSLTICSELNLLPQWWVLRVTRHLLKDLWGSSFHKIIPGPQNDGHDTDWNLLRWLFITSLYKRNKAEIELWPSQLEGAKRAVKDDDNLVVSLPTSAGKTRIAELCILRCLSIGKRVLFITPLRALSAQTEYSLRKTFLPLGKTISSLYGSMGTSDFEQDVLRTQDIVVGTPEKLDFALRNDPTLIDDVGLVILDEGHMIGLSEREINYEVQIQRLLKRQDSNERRIVCLSAILPSGDQFEDFVGWLRQDKEGDAIQSDWRPTDLRFGEIVWQGHTAKIDFTVGEEQAFIPGFIQSFIPPIGRRVTPFPKNAKELTLASAWKLVEDKQTVLIYCPEKRSVNSFAKDIVDLHQRGALGSVLSVDPEKIEFAKVLGAEWLGEEHPILQCLNIGVAVHHGGLPTPFRKEMEKLLRDGILKITISSPTLAQGLNLAATALIVYSVRRSGNVIDSSEFKNVVGRAGRAFVDTHGLVLHPIYDRIPWRRNQWRELVNNTNARNMESGLFRLIATFIQRIASSLQTQSIEQVLEYIMNNINVWTFPTVPHEAEQQEEENRNAWEQHLVSLDTALLSMLGEENIPIDNIPNVLDELLQSSLLQRRLNRHEGEIQVLFKGILKARGKYIWGCSTAAQRKGYYLAGVGLVTGQRLDEIAPQANDLLIVANAYILDGDQEQEAITAITSLAELLFTIPPFTPNILPGDWHEILEAWLKGDALRDHDFESIDDTLRFVEDGLVYRLPWGLEALRVRAQANNDVIFDEMTIDDFEVGLIVPAVENGSLNRSAAILMQAGFSSRLEAINSIQSTEATFSNSRGFKDWLSSERLAAYISVLGLVNENSATLWATFLNEYKPKSDTVWQGTSVTLPVNWKIGVRRQIGQLIKLYNEDTGVTKVLSSDGEVIGKLRVRYNLLKNGVYRSELEANNYLKVTYWGAGEKPFEMA
ncbi:DEAD/DEAH box helicase [Pseudoalteromonas prydzensis]|uniref:DEAD/DEAH box helicase n=1 Tax=Pseudoalteromonas prydzensis TaxID=182141 RepID=UPI0024BC5F58|nr:DEAD/DEAH box helicase [Pseudoalteromonas prydzensis]